jgi:DNA-binding NarL/FixJ family response regulator
MTGLASPIQIIVADDHQVIRTGFAALLNTQPDFTVVGTASDGVDAIRICGELSPDVVLMDIRMPKLDGIEATRQLAGSETGPRILMLTTFDLDEYVYDALRAGASGFLLKDVTAERLFDAVRVIAAGDALLAPAITRRLIGEFARLQPESIASLTPLSVLTPRETQVLRLVAAVPEDVARVARRERSGSVGVHGVSVSAGRRRGLKHSAVRVCRRADRGCTRPGRARRA